MQIEIQAQHTEVHPRWRVMIQRRAAKLAEIYRRIIRLHVTLVHSTHHLGGSEEVRLLLAVPNEALRVQKTRASMGDAIHAAFAALHEELRARKKRQQVHHRMARAR
jgi:ribosomal subunit interface protein